MVNEYDRLNKDCLKIYEENKGFVNTINNLYDQQQDYYSILNLMDINTDNCYGTKIKVCPNCDYWLHCTGSMKPTFNCKSTLHIQKCNNYKVGDIIMFKDKEGNYPFIIHRIWRLNGDKFITKGDSNQDIDLFDVKKNDVIGKVVEIHY